MNEHKKKIKGKRTIKSGILIGIGFVVGTNLASFLYFHAVTWQGIMSSVIGFFMIIVVSTIIENCS